MMADVRPPEKITVSDQRTTLCALTILQANCVASVSLHSLRKQGLLQEGILQNLQIHMYSRSFNRNII